MRLHRKRAVIEAEIAQAEEDQDLDKILELLAELDSLDRHEVRR